MWCITRRWGVGRGDAKGWRRGCRGGRGGAGRSWPSGGCTSRTRRAPTFFFQSAPRHAALHIPAPPVAALLFRDQMRGLLRLPHLSPRPARPASPPAPHSPPSSLYPRWLTRRRATQGTGTSIPPTSTPSTVSATIYTRTCAPSPTRWCKSPPAQPWPRWWHPHWRRCARRRSGCAGGQLWWWAFPPWCSPGRSTASGQWATLQRPSGSGSIGGCTENVKL